MYLKSFIYISFMVRIKKGQKVKQKVKCAGIWPWPFIIPLSVPVNEIDTVYQKCEENKSNENFRKESETLVF